MQDSFVILVPAVFAGLVAIAITVAIERLGGIVGGLLGTLPTTIVPAALGIWAAAPDLPTFAAAMGSAPVGMLVATLFLLSWRVVPPRLPDVPVAGQLALMLLVSLSLWAVLAGVAVLTLAQLPLPAWVAGLGALLLNVALGLWASAQAVPAPRGTRSVPPGVLLARGLLAGLAVGVASWLAHTGDGFLSGIAAVFPAIFLTTMAGLWVSQGHAVPAGAVGPMMLGATAVGTFSLLTVPLYPALGAGLGSITAWGLAAGLVTVPSLWWLRR